MKHTYTKSVQAHHVNVGLDVFGNAIPEIKSAAVEGTGKALRIIKRHDMLLKPSPKSIRASERLEYAFRQLHQEFNEREQILETKMHALQQVQQSLSAVKAKQRWLLPMVLVAGTAGGYMMYIMSSMQSSMIAMSGNINSMNGHMGAMATDTQTMNQSLYYMNNNVAYMSGNVAQMNQKVGTLAQAAEPMGEAASTMNPFMKAFKSIMPF
ncbi:MAG: hypothetical protein BWK73_35960 [Thiothrix lacustris]|uniref:Uncharacterized protein n=1 Tax=Thiothrix lacustris TaxID=525917 RepID=A0A1Y1QFS5_9GAMM|nr:MAG: hypothetical protein BWK73_35960 [Thiothrix lacustris]